MIMKKLRIHTKKRILLVIGLALALLILLTGLAVSGVMVDKDGKTTINVDRGDGTVIIASKLESAGAIKGELLFRVVAHVTGNDSTWKTGTYTVPSGSSYFDIFQTLSVPSDEFTVTIPEGKQVREIATILEDAGVCDRDEFLEACQTHTFDYEFLQDVPASKRIGGLEGYLFPDTYSFVKDEDVDEVIETMLDRFEEMVYTDEVRDKVAESGYSFDQIIILSSMVESEAATESDRKLVAGVFLNRLNHPDKFPKLQSCVTVEYAMGVKKSIISAEDTKYDSPYNTYLYSGLPFGPICCPGLESIMATLEPTESNYYYFQSDGNGKLYFAETWKEHAATQKKIQKNMEVTTEAVE